MNPRQEGALVIHWGPRQAQLSLYPACPYHSPYVGRKAIPPWAAHPGPSVSFVSPSGPFHKGHSYPVAPSCPVSPSQHFSPVLTQEGHCGCPVPTACPPHPGKLCTHCTGAGCSHRPQGHRPWLEGVIHAPPQRPLPALNSPRPSSRRLRKVNCPPFSALPAKGSGYPTASCEHASSGSGPTSQADGQN